MEKTKGKAGGRYTPVRIEKDIYIKIKGATSLNNNHLGKKKKKKEDNNLTSLSLWWLYSRTIQPWSELIFFRGCSGPQGLFLCSELRRRKWTTKCWFVLFFFLTSYLLLLLQVTGECKKKKQENWNRLNRRHVIFSFISIYLLLIFIFFGINFRKKKETTGQT